MKKILLVAGVLAVVASPAYAQSYDPYFNGGHWVSSQFNSPHWGGHHSAARARGYEAYGMAPDGGYLGSNSPAATGGGSTGYNEMEKEQILNH
jgi:hypothetical protein